LGWCSQTWGAGGQILRAPPPPPPPPPPAFSAPRSQPLLPPHLQISDLLRQLLAVSRNGLPPAKRVKTNADGGLAEGTPVKLKQGTSVTLGPSTHGQPPPYSGLLPPPAAALVPWVFSHEVPREGGKETDACIMNLPCTLEAMSLPLFYLYGHVPRDALLTG
jgi:hypothetical protein